MTLTNRCLDFDPTLPLPRFNPAQDPEFNYSGGPSDPEDDMGDIYDAESDPEVMLDVLLDQAYLREDWETVEQVWFGGQA